MMKSAPGVALSLLLTACGPAADAPGAGNAQSSGAMSDKLRIPVLLVPEGGKAHRLSAEIALTPEEQARGLSGRKSIGADDAMIFPLFPPRLPSFWMKDTLVPLDIIFVRTDGTIDMIAANAKPLDLTPISSGTPASGVIELRGGQAKKLGLDVGDRVSWGACTTDPAARPAMSAENFCPAP